MSTLRWWAHWIFGTGKRGFGGWAVYQLYIITGPPTHSVAKCRGQTSNAHWSLPSSSVGVCNTARPASSVTSRAGDTFHTLFFMLTVPGPLLQEFMYPPLVGVGPTVAIKLHEIMARSVCIGRIMSLAESSSVYGTARRGRMMTGYSICI